ncbi:phage-related tail transmembrane protein [Burkholderia lata]|uniref:hypothetical protein n=1 Tax=Burkholderia lata (strain ATCC 17760 / DSM 23089 / LMG 22485 / NCIMB 9086 / R18194 / 383) TaxID=482957 RepID=UPI001453739C|nr:hypothetical protein [Burkholderia lata]VWC91135.1 phage-related tail transmembrane protein [Burkholderia lata]
MNNELKLRVVFGMVEKITAPLKKIIGGSRAASKELGTLQQKLSQLQNQKRTVDAVKSLRAEMGRTATKLKEARAGVADLTAKIRDTKEPTVRMQNSLRRASAAVVSLTAQQARQRDRLGELNSRMQQAGRGTQTLTEYERALHASIARTNGALSDQGRKLQSVQARKAALAPAREQLQKTQTFAAGMAVAGYATRTVGGRVLGGMGHALNEAKEYEQQVSQFRALGVGETKLGEATKFADGIDVKGLSKLDKLKLLKETYTITRDMHHAEEMAPLLAKMKVGIESVMARRGYGEGHGEVAENMLMDLVKTTELRGSLKSPEAFKQAVDNATKAYVASGGTVKPEDFLNAIKTGGIAAKQLGDNAFYFGLLHTMQEMGGFRAGTGLMSAYTNWAQGRTTQQSGEELVKAGLINKKSVKYGKTGHVTKILPEALNQIELYKTDPFEYLMKEIIPKINPKGNLTDMQVVSKIGHLFSSRKGGDFFASLFLERANIMKHRENAPKAFGVDALYNEGTNIAYGKEMDALAKRATLEAELGEKILPLYNRGLELTSKLLSRVTEFTRQHGEATRIALVALAALGVILGVGGTLMIGLAAIIGPLAMVRFGLRMLGVESKAAVGGINVGSGALGRFSKVTKVFSSAGGAATKTASRLRFALSAAWDASSPRNFARTVSTRIPAAYRAARDASKKWGVDAVASVKRGTSATREYIAELGRAAAAKRAAITSRVVSAGRYVASRGVRGVAGDAVRGGFSLVKGGARGAIAGVAGALAGLGQTLLFVGRLALTNPIGIAITAIALAALLIVRYWEPIKAFFSGFWEGLKEGLAPLSGIFSGLFASLGELFAPLKPVWDWLLEKVQVAWDWFKKLFGPVDTTKESLDKASSSGKEFGKWLGGLIVTAAEASKQFVDFGANMMQGLVNGITNGLKSVKDAITNVASSTVAWFKEKLGIHSPSRVFGELGGFIGQGAANGIDGERVRVASSAARLAGVAAVTFGAATGTGAALAASMEPMQSPVRAEQYRPLIDQRGPLAASTASAGSGRQGGGSEPSVHHYTFNITAPSGNADDIKAAVRQALQDAERERRRRGGSSLSDIG